MNTVLASRYDEIIDRLVLGIEPVDGARRRRLAQPVEVIVEPRLPFGNPLSPEEKAWLISLRERTTGPEARGRALVDSWSRAERHPSCLHALRFRQEIGDRVDLRILDRSQRFVPRRLRVPLVPLGAPPDLALLDALPVGQRSRRPALFPGAAYDVSECVTGLRGRAVVRAGVPPRLIAARWARVQALDQNNRVVGVAHADHQGEFLLLIAPEAVQVADLPSPFTLSVRVRGTKPPPAPPPREIVDVDAFWDIPRETAAAPGSVADPVMDGTAPVPAFTASVSRAVDFTFGALISGGIAPFEIT